MKKYGKVAGYIVVAMIYAAHASEMVPTGSDLDIQTNFRGSASPIVPNEGNEEPWEHVLSEGQTDASSKEGGFLQWLGWGRKTQSLSPAATEEPKEFSASTTPPEAIVSLLQYLSVQEQKAFCALAQAMRQSKERKEDVPLDRVAEFLEATVNVKIIPRDQEFTSETGEEDNTESENEAHRQEESLETEAPGVADHVSQEEPTIWQTFVGELKKELRDFMANFNGHEGPHQRPWQ